MKRWSAERAKWAITGLTLSASNFVAAPTGASTLTRFLKLPAQSEDSKAGQALATCSQPSEHHSPCCTPISSTATSHSRDATASSIPRKMAHQQRLIANHCMAVPSCRAAPSDAQQSMSASHAKAEEEGEPPPDMYGDLTAGCQREADSCLEDAPAHPGDCGFTPPACQDVFKTSPVPEHTHHLAQLPSTLPEDIHPGFESQDLGSPAEGEGHSPIQPQSKPGSSPSAEPLATMPQPVSSDCTGRLPDQHTNPGRACLDRGQGRICVEGPGQRLGSTEHQGTRLGSHEGERLECKAASLGTGTSWPDCRPPRDSPAQISFVQRSAIEAPILLDCLEEVCDCLFRICFVEDARHNASSGMKMWKCPVQVVLIQDNGSRSLTWKLLTCKFT